MSKVNEVRYQRAQEILLENALDMATMAACLGMDENKSQKLFGPNPKHGISDSLAKQIEQTFSKPLGWLSQNEDSPISFDLFGS